MTSQGNTSKALSDIGKRPNTRSRSREIQSSEDMPPFEVAKNIWEKISKPPKGGIVIKENHAIDEHYSSSKPSSEEMPHPNIMSVMVTNVDTSENRMAELEKKVNMLMKVVEERDYEIAFLKNHIESRDAAESSHKHTVKNTDKGKAVMQESQPQNSTSIASLSVQQLQEMIASSIKMQYGGPAQTFSLYFKPYTKRIDNLRMPNGYQPPKFQQFDGKGNPKQHVAHFIKTCETAGTRGDLLVKQFVRTLKGNACDWYIDLEPESIDNWEQLERDFLNRFYSTRHIVSMMELTNTRQQKGELVIDYINRWRALSLDCKDRLTELSAVEMCTQGMHWGLLYILQGIKPRTFEELATRAHDMELSIANRGAKDFLIPKSRSDKNELDDTKKIANSVIKESMVVHATPLKSFSKRKETKIERKHDGDEKRQSTLKERQEKVYPFPDSDVADMLEQLLENQLIQLPECKRPEQAGKVDDPNYCKYHRVISHPVEKCFVLKELILKLAREKKIELDIDEVAQTNHAIEMTSNPIKGKDEDFLQLRRSITLAEFLPRSFLEDDPEEILEVTACHAASIVEVDNNYGSSKEVNNSNEINQRTSVFDRIKPSTTRSSVFQRLSVATKEEENQCPTFIYTRTSTSKRLSISTLKKDRPSTSSFDRLKMTNDQQQREMKSSKAKPFREENDDDKIHSCVPSRMKRKLFVDINTEGSLTVKPRFIIFTNPTNEGDEQILVENKSC
ncbi:ty3-gypsy retrotransposon protein [Cucumis melo var. makuwa]|uniref:Ty3-gypsy retrotransposon protein n=1 Tax=Cucumis melo var. makuwa TaxID=1194695 RepID=A0A5A7URH1_CUCMM|nr:ty3-gypsy retrotransposon protein [Cucumis melo var. makuwa]